MTARDTAAESQAEQMEVSVQSKDECEMYLKCAMLAKMKEVREFLAQIDGSDLQRLSIDDLFKFSESADQAKNEFDSCFYNLQATVRKTIKAKTLSTN